MDRVPSQPVKDPPNLILSGASNLDRLLSHVDPPRGRNPRSSSATSMSSAVLTPPPTATARLVVDTDVASFVFKWHPEFVPHYVDLLRGSLVLSSPLVTNNLKDYRHLDKLQIVSLAVG